MSIDSNSWETPDWLFKQLDKEFNFDIDLCATKANSKCDFWCDDYLLNIVEDKDGGGFYLHELIDLNAIHSGFMNPPYSCPKPFIEKAWEDSKRCKIVCLVKVDPSTKWWATFWNYGTGDENCGGMFWYRHMGRDS